MSHRTALHIRIFSLPGVAFLAVSLFAGPPSFRAPATYQVGQVPEAIAIGDLNGDGLADAAIANSSAKSAGGADEDSVTVLLGTRNGTLELLGSFPAGNRPEGIQVFRGNQDEFPDVVTANLEGNSVSVLLGDGSGGLAAPSVLSVPGGPRYVVAADLNGDGSMDLATANFNGDSISVLKGNGQGGFGLSNSVSVRDGPEVLAIAHLDDDGDLDLVTANSNHDSISPLSGDGKGGFTVKSFHRVSDEPRFVIARDLDGDKLDDLIVANHDSNMVSVERNRGGFDFERAATLTESQLERCVYLDLADLDGDCALDILATWAMSNVFTVFPGTLTDSFSFGPAAKIPAGNHPVGIAVFNIDGDDDLEVLVTNAFDDTAFLYRSTVTHSTPTHYKRGDPNSDGRANLSDSVYLLMFLFRGGEVPSCERNADMNDSGTVNISDAVYLLLHLVEGGPPPPPPFTACGEDATDDDLTCESYAPCEAGPEPEPGP